MAGLPTIYYGAVVNPQSLTSYQALARCLLAVSSEGTIDWIVDDVDDSMVQEVMSQKGCVDAEVVPLREGEFLMPGFVDTHTHAPQVPNMGSGQQHELLDWLDNVTFPMEANFADVEFARETYVEVVRRVINCGTTMCCYYGTLHVEATKILAEIIHVKGQRAFVGKCNMDRNSPDYYVEPSPEASVAGARELITYIRSLPPSPHTTTPLVHPILTPRFAISCTSPLLSSLQSLALSDPALAIQTHISENPSEIAFTLSLFPNASSYAQVYDSFSLLRENTILAHAVHLQDEEKQLIKERKAGISHCPTSNFNLSSGVAPVGDLLDRGIKVGLGTDVSGGFSPSILTAVQHASIASKVIAMNARDTSAVKDGTFANRALTIPALLYLATMGGAEVCCLDKQIGNFSVSKSFDALIINVGKDNANPAAVWGEPHPPRKGGNHTKPKSKKEELDGWLEKFLFCGDDRNIRRVYVQGRLIGGTAFSG
ncbi:Metallo-dependent hydrolase [Pleurotus eryngii]|uniref:Guanine deaminase n=1 Tax=Pleurotus eryngii TaxID=5323 RepID=A0A9P6A7F0_PLEER|nr:Metallo-dependent hydrolase [Pleurotus eryngii]